MLQAPVGAGHGVHHQAQAGYGQAAEGETGGEARQIDDLGPPRALSQHCIFGPHHFADRGAQLLHGGLALAILNRARQIHAAGLTQLDPLDRDLYPFGSRGLHPRDPARLPRIVAHQGLKLRRRRRDHRPATVEGAQETIVAGDDKPALATLDVLNQAGQGLGGFDHLVTVADPVPALTHGIKMPGRQGHGQSCQEHQQNPGRETVAPSAHTGKLKSGHGAPTATAVILYNLKKSYRTVEKEPAQSRVRGESSHPARPC